MNNLINMRKIKLFFTVLLLSVFLIVSAVSYIFADAPGNKTHHRNVIHKKNKKVYTDTSSLLDSTDLQDSTNIYDSLSIKKTDSSFFELVEPKHLAIGGGAITLVIFSFVILSKMRNKQ